MAALSNQLESLAAKTNLGKLVYLTNNKTGQQWRFESVMWGGVSPYVILVNPAGVRENKTAADWRRAGFEFGRGNYTVVKPAKAPKSLPKAALPTPPLLIDTLLDLDAEDKLIEATNRADFLARDLQEAENDLARAKADFEEADAALDKAKDAAEERDERIEALETLLSALGIEGMALEYALNSAVPAQGLSAFIGKV